MAYATANLSLIVETMAGQFNIWVYKSADAYATVKASNYITDALAKGMLVGDLVMILDTGGPTLTLAMMVTVTSSGGTMSQTGVVPST